MNKPVSPTERLSIEAVLRMGSTRAGRVKLWYLVAASFIALLLLLWLVVGSTATSTQYLTDPATRGVLTVVVTATGSVQPTNQVDVSSELSGIVRNVLVDYNSPVKIGQVLAELDTDKLKATVDNSRAKLDAAKAKVTEAEETVIEKEQDYNRKASLVEKHITSTLNFEVARALYRRAQAVRESSRADVAVAEADLKLNETNLAKAAIRSPINGVVLARNVDPGQTVASSFQAPVLFSIAEDLTQMEIQVDVDEADVGTVKVGQKATFTVDAYPDRKFQAEIRELRYGSQIVQGVVTYKAVLTTDNSQLLLRPGMTATAEISVQHIDDALLVANAGLRFSPPTEDTAQQDGGLLKRLLPGRPQFRPASSKEDSGANRTLWTLRDGAPVRLNVVIGATDGKRTEVVKVTSSRGRQLSSARRQPSAEGVNPVETQSTPPVPLVQLKGVTKVYGSGQATVHALNSINLSIDAGEFVAIMGPSGSGKSTAMNIIGCLDVPSSGEYFFEGVEVGYLNRNQRALLRRHFLGFVFQGFNLLARTTAVENVELPLIYRGTATAERRRLAVDALERVGLKGREHHTSGQLSGGQQQRVAIARAIVTEPAVLLADEPNGNLDSKTSREIMDLLTMLNRERGITVVMVTHEPDMAAYAGRIIRFVDGRIAADEQKKAA